MDLSRPQQYANAQVLQGQLAALPAPQIGPIDLSGGGGPPAIPAPSLMPTAQPNQVLTAQQKYNDAVNSKPGVATIHNPFLRGLAEAGDIASQVAGSVFLPAAGIAAAIPGTTFHHERQVNLAADNLAQAQDQAQRQAQTDQESALTAHENAATDVLLHPRPEYQPLDTDNGIVNYDKNGGTTSPLMGPNGQPLTPYTKPGPTEHVIVKGADGNPVFANYQGGKYLDAQGKEIPNARPYEKPAGDETAHPINIDGHPGFGLVVPGKGWVDPATGQPITGKVTPIPPPPNYGQLILPTKTATYIDPATNLPTEMQWNPKTNKYDIPLGLSASNAYGHEAAQAGAVERSGNDLIQVLQANRAQLGTLGAWVKLHGLNTPIADPTLEGVRAQLASFAALNPAMHGARGGQAMQHFEEVIGGAQQNPDATIAGIRGIIRGAAQPILGQGSGGAAVIYARDSQGKLHQAPAGTALPKGWKQENR